ncbi:MAG: glycine cleavage system aminomethyltransferase GcvT [Candidatus Omnitrophica bacterium]|nr:glycine cleavage system aminomethyltransferase GcvT [Candidatus Omnitrophota bacterium]
MHQSPLAEIHQNLGAQLMDFGGWRLPVSFSTIVEEHLATRQRAGLFDISHLGQIEVSGPQALERLQFLLTADLSVTGAGQSAYSLMCREDGGILDDLYVYRLEEERYLLAVNASHFEEDAVWIQGHGPGKPDISDLSLEMGGVALQGPLAPQILERWMPDVYQGIELRGVRTLSWQGEEWVVARTGYTGEPGVEIFGPKAGVPDLWESLMQVGRSEGLKPAGLGARDTLRLEMGYPLYGSDMDATTTPVEANLKWTVSLDKPDFMGKEAIARQVKQGVSRRLAGIALTERGIPRGGCPIKKEGAQVGKVTSGTHSPSLERGIGLGYVEVDLAKPGTALSCEIRGRAVSAEVTKLPFYRR